MNSLKIKADTHREKNVRDEQPVSVSTLFDSIEDLNRSLSDFVNSVDVYCDTLKKIDMILFSSIPYRE